MVLQVEGLRKRFGRRVAVDAISFQIEAGEVVGLIGPNGAGKTTTMRMVAGFLEPDDGVVKVFGIDVARDRVRAQERIGYLPEGNPLYGEMTPLTYLRFIAEARGIERKAARGPVMRAAQDAGIGAAISRPIEVLSAGYRRRVGLAAALIHDPMLLVLDEPTDGLDPHQRDGLRALIARLGTERAVLISTHRMEEVTASCTRVILIDRGRIVADDTPAALAAAYSDGLEGAFRALTRGEAA
jgi:ABC-2 type transport system ATP-binding protein